MNTIRGWPQCTLQSVDGGSYVIDLCSLQQLRRVISVQVMTEMESVDESYQIFRIGGEFLGSKNTALGYTAVHSVELRLLIIMMVRMCSTSEVRAEPAQSRTIDAEEISRHA